MLTFKVESVLYASCLSAKVLRHRKQLFNNLNLSICVGTLVDEYQKMKLRFQLDFNELSDQSIIYYRHSQFIIILVGMVIALELLFCSFWSQYSLSHKILNWRVWFSMARLNAGGRPNTCKNERKTISPNLRGTLRRRAADGWVNA